MSNTKAETTNHKGIKYYFGMLLCYIGSIIFIINNLYLFYAVISFAYVKFGVGWAIVCFLAFPLTIVFGPIYLCSITNDWWLIVNFALLLGFSSIIIGIGDVLTKPFKIKEKSADSTEPINGIHINGGIESDTSTPPPLPSESSVEPPTLPEDASHSEIKVYKIEESKFDSIIFIIATIIFSCVVLLIAIGFFTFAIEYLRPGSNYTSNTTPYANTTPPSAVTPQQVDSTSRAVLPEISESFILRTDTYLEIRKEPTMESKIIAKIPESSYIISIKKDYTGQNGSEWSLITLGPYEGWVPKRFLSKITKYQK